MGITQSLARVTTNYDNQNSLGSKFRGKRIVPLLQLIEQISQEHGRVNIVDIGGEEIYWSIVPQHYLEEHNVKITIVNLPSVKLPANHGAFTFLHADGCDLSAFEDNSFHIAHSNSVIEHVGDWNRMVQFAKEFKRVARNYFIQTPNFWFPVEPHFMTPFFHWLPQPLRVWLVLNFSLGHLRRAASVDTAVRTVESARLLSKPMFRELFSDSRLMTEWFAFMPKSLIAMRLQKPRWQDA